MSCTSTCPVNKQVLAFTFATNLILCTMIVRWRNSLAASCCFRIRELLKWITKWYWNLSELYKCRHICHHDRFIFYTTLWVFHNASKSKLLTLIKKEFICSTVLQTVFVLFASQLTAALPFSMRTSSYTLLLLFTFEVWLHVQLTYDGNPINWQMLK